MEAYYTSLANKACRRFPGLLAPVQSTIVLVEWPTMRCLHHCLAGSLHYNDSGTVRKLFYLCRDAAPAAAELPKGYKAADWAVNFRIIVAVQDRAQMAETLHRANLLCVLANGLLLDQAADEPLVQASALLCFHICGNVSLQSSCLLSPPSSMGGMQSVVWLWEQCWQQ